MASQAKNPFLMGETDPYEVVQDTSNFNPFLGENVFEASNSASNPFFLNESSTVSQDFTTNSQNYTNPFADFFSTSTTTSSMETEKKYTECFGVSENIFTTPATITSNTTLLDGFLGAPANPLPSSVASTFPTEYTTPPLQRQASDKQFSRLESDKNNSFDKRFSSDMKWNTAAQAYMSPRSSLDTRRQSDVLFQSAMPRVSLEMRRQSDIMWNANGQRRVSAELHKTPPDRPGPPRRPPPPRPTTPATTPASKETQDLILTVTGALEATSSDLLDRLQATRTPSPTPMSELLSPSPIPELINNLLGDEEVPVRPHHSTGGNYITAADLQEEEFNVFHAIANLPKGDDIDILKEKSPLPIPPPSLPIRPPPPPPPKINQDNIFEIPQPETIHNVTPFDPVNSFPGVGNRLDEKQVIEEASRKSSLILDSSRTGSIDSRGSNSDIFASDVIFGRSGGESNFGVTVTGAHGSNLPQKSSIENVSSVGGVEYLKYPEKYTHARKASHDISSENVQIIPARKKYSLDYSSDRMFDKTLSDSEMDNNNKILEVPKFSVFSTTPIISNESIATTNEYEDSNLDFGIPVRDPKTDSFGLQTESGDFNYEVNYTKPSDEFDAFSAKFESFRDQNDGRSNDPFDPFSSSAAEAIIHQQADEFESSGFGSEAPFDEFLSMKQPPPGVPVENVSVTMDMWSSDRQSYSTGYAQDTSSTFNPFSTARDNDGEKPSTLGFNEPEQKFERSESNETPPTPLFDEDVSQPLEPFPRVHYEGSGWDMQFRYPIRKKFTNQRLWKKVFVRLVYQGEIPHLELLSKEDKKEKVLHEWPLQPCYAISEIGAQHYDQYGKIFTVKIQFVVYKERPGVRPGQITKAERITNKLSQFAAYAIQGDYQGVKEFGSDLKKLGLPVEHSPQISLICKLGSNNYEDMKQFSVCVEEALFHLSAHRDNIHITYKMEEVQITAVDELYVEQAQNGSILKQIARVRLFFLGFLSGIPDVEIGVNDLRRQGKEVVGRHDIIPVVTEEWIRLEDVEFHSCVQQNVYEETKTIKFKPPDACYLELMRFRVRPPRNRELPLQVKTTFRVTGNKVDIYSDIIVPGFTSRKLGQIPCEDVSIRIPIPECWIYLFRVEKHFRYGSVKSAHRRTGKVKGLERFLGAVENLEPHLIEVTSGHAKYEHHHSSIVWRMSRLPKEGQGAYTVHNLVCHLALTSFDQIPNELAKYCYVEFTMPITQASHTTVRSVSITNTDSDDPAEKCVRHLARHEYKVEISHTQGEEAADYITATRPKIEKKPSVAPQPVSKIPECPQAESDSDFSD